MSTVQNAKAHSRFNMPQWATVPAFFVTIIFQCTAWAAEHDTRLAVSFDSAAHCLHIDGGSTDAIACDALADGGIEISGANGIVRSSAPMDSVDSIECSASRLTLNSFRSAGSLHIRVKGDLVVAGTICVGREFDARARNITVSGTVAVPGGRIALLPQRESAGIGGGALVLSKSARLNVSASSGGGEILLGGNYQGQGELPHATVAFIAAGAEINADALDSGTAGRVIVWSDAETRFHGSISARGGALGGDGGFVEVSSKGHLDFAGQTDTSAIAGAAGKLLLDPDAIIIQGAMADLNGDGTLGDDISTAADLALATNFPGKTSIITAGALRTVLAGSDVTLASVVSVAWNAALDINGLGVAGRTLTITSGSITINGAGGIFDSNPATPDKLNLSLQGTGTVSIYGPIATGGGSLTVSGITASNYGIQVGGSITVNTGGGNIMLTGSGSLEGIHFGTGVGLVFGAGSLTINGTTTGTSGFTHGVYFDGAVNLIQAGNISITGTGANLGAGVFFQSGVHVESTGGTCSVIGTGNGRHGIFTSSTTQNAASATTYFAGNLGLTVTGNGTEFGIFAPGHDTYVAPGPITIPADYTNASFLSAAGPVTVTGNALVTPSANSGTGRHGFQINGNCTITGAGNVALTGAATEIGVMVLQKLTVSSSAGTTTVVANSSGRHGLHAVTGFDISGSQGVSITANSTQHTIDSDSGMTVNSANGPITVMATATVGPTGEGKRGINLWQGALTVHGKGDVSITASSTHTAINSVGMDVTSDTGKVTIDGEASVGTGPLAGDGHRAITLDQAGTGSLSVHAGGDILIKARDTATSIEARGATIVSTNGAVTIDPLGGANTFHCLHLINGPTAISAAKDISVISDSEINTSSLSCTTTTGAITLTANTVRTDNCGGIWSTSGPLVLQAAKDINVSTQCSLESIYGTGVSAISTAGAVNITAAQTTIGFTGHQNYVSNGNTTMSAAKDIVFNTGSTGQCLYTQGMNLTSTTGKVTVNAAAVAGGFSHRTFTCTGNLAVNAAGDVSIDSSGNQLESFVGGTTNVTSTAGAVSLKANNAGRFGWAFGSDLTVNAANDISLTGSSGNFGIVVNGAESLTSTGGAVTVLGDTSTLPGSDSFGLTVNGGATISASKDISYTGKSSWHGITIGGASNFTSSTGGITVLADTTAKVGSASFGAMEFVGSTTMTARNDISITGKSAWFGIIQVGTLNLTSTNGGVSLNGDATLAFGPHYQGVVFCNTTTINALNNISIIGKGSWSGIVLNSSNLLTSTQGGVTLNGDASASGGQGRCGITASVSAPLTVTAQNDIALIGKSSLTGLNLPNTNILTSKGGNIVLNGDGTAGTTDTGRYGMDINGLTANAVGNISLIGKGTEFGVNLYGSGESLTSTGGQVIINADSTVVPVTFDSFGTPTGRQAFTSNTISITGATGVSITGKATEFGVVLWGADTPILAPNGVVTLDVDATTAIDPTVTLQLDPGQQPPTGRHGIASFAPYTLDGLNGVNITGKANVFAIELLSPNTVHSAAGPITLHGTSTTYYGIFSEADISGVGIDATGVNLSGVDNVGGIDINSGTFDATTGQLKLNGTAAATDINVQGVLVDAGTLTNTGAGNLISIIGTSPARGVMLAANSTVTSNGGNISIVGTSTAAFGSEEQGVLIEDGLSNGAQVSSANGNIDITGLSQASDGILVGSTLVFGPGCCKVAPRKAPAAPVKVDVGTGFMTLTADTINLETTSAPSLVGAGGTVLLEPYTPSLPFTVGGNGTSDSVFLAQSEIAQLADGFASIIVGRADSSGTLTVTPEGATFLDNVTLRSPSNGAFSFAGTVDGGTNNVTLINGGLFTRTGGTVNANVLTLSGTGDVGTNLGNGVYSAATTIVLDKAGHNVYAVEADNVNLEGSAGTLTATTLNGAMTQVNPLNISGATTLSSGDKAITLTNGANQFGPLTFTGGAVQITQANTMNVLSSFAQSATLISGADQNILGTLSTSSSPLPLLASRFFSGGGPIVLQHAGTLTVTPTGQVLSGDSVTELGAGPVVLKNIVMSNNKPVIFNGALTAIDGLTITAGTSSVTFNGPVSPGLAGPGKLNIAGSLVLSSTATYNIDIVSSAAGSFDQIVATGTVSAGGTIGGTAAPGIADADLFPVILNGSASPVAGTFTAIPELGVAKVGTTFFTTTYLGGDGNDIVLNLDHAPLVASATVMPVPLFVGVNGIFTVFASDPDNNPLTTTYDYGDGTTDTAGVHAYGAPGVYTAIITVSDGGLTAQTTVTVVVTSRVRFRAKLALDLGPASSQTDKLTLNGFIYIPPKTTFAGKTFTLQIGSSVETFVLNEAGVATSADGVAKIILSPLHKKRGGDSQFKIVAHNADFSSVLMGSAAPVVKQVPVSVSFGGVTLTSVVKTTFKARKDRVIGNGHAP